MRYLPAAILCLGLFWGCRVQNVSSFWNTHSIDYTDISAAEEQFADFAELAVAAPERDAMVAMDVLFDKLKQDPVAYYIYSNWIDGAFYNPLSPCRNATLYVKAVERMMSDGIFDQAEWTPFHKRSEWIHYNLEGSAATVPGLSQIERRTLILVLDLSCPSCREALETLASAPEWDGVDKVAVCMGYGSMPSVPNWDYLFPENASDVFDIHMTPVYFVVAADGTVERGYKPAL